MQHNRVQMVIQSLKTTKTTFAPAQVSTQDQIEQLIHIANAVGLYDAADCLKVRFQKEEEAPSTPTPVSNSTPDSTATEKKDVYWKDYNEFLVNLA